jgi:cytochrome c-type biogenesis protein CcmH
MIRNGHCSLWIFGVALLLVTMAGRAEIDVYQFDSPAQEARFERLIKELRCPKCQNNSLHDSDALIARDLRQIIYEQIRAGKTDAEIVSYLRARYGDFISYRPPLRPSTWLLWFGPLVLLLAGAWGIRGYVRQRRTTGKDLRPTAEVDEWLAEASQNRDETKDDN